MSIRISAETEEELIEFFDTLEAFFEVNCSPKSYDSTTKWKKSRYVNTIKVKPIKKSGRKSIVTREMKIKMEDRRAEGASYQKIANEIGCSKATVINYLVHGWGDAE